MAESLSFPTETLESICSDFNLPRAMISSSPELKAGNTFSSSILKLVYTERVEGSTDYMLSVDAPVAVTAISKIIPV